MKAYLAFIEAVLCVLLGFALGVFCLVRFPDSLVSRTVTGWANRLAGESESAVGGAESHGDGGEGAKTAESKAERPIQAAAERDGAAAIEKKESDQVHEFDPNARWQGLVDGNWYSGRKFDEKSLEGKVVLVYEFGVGNESSMKAMARVEQIWNSFRTKPFVVIGSHREGRTLAAERAIAAAKPTFPVYQGVRHVASPDGPRAMPYFYVIDHRGKLAYHGKSDREATEVFVSAITDATLANSSQKARGTHSLKGAKSRPDGATRKANTLKGGGGLKGPTRIN